MTRERAQALVEAAVAVPVCLACAMTLVDGGILVRDRIATAQAATHAAEARLEGRDAITAARRALPRSLRDSFQLDQDGDHLVLRATSRTALARMAGRGVEHRSSIVLPATEATR